ncbi:hypothetical protein [Chishuiella changwenlii]|uniref:hypothetical protein n=1 Tax=Chishuiella changwenlii TaxID=1434701 RepID=UPI002FDA8421
MSQENSIFKKWVPQKMVVPIFMITLFPHMMILSLFNMNSTFTASFLDLEVDDLQFLFSLAYAMIVCGLFIHVRFFHFFNVRNYLLTMTMLNIIVLFSMTLTTNKELVLLLRFIQGPLTILEGAILLPIIMANIKNENSKLITYSFLYGLILTGDKITTSIAKFAIQNYNHNMMVYTIMILHVVALTIYVFFFNQNRMFPKKPLYQLNLGGIFLMMISLISGAFFLIYGKKYNWFESSYIVLAFASTLIFSGLFIIHQKTTKRPLFNFEVLQSERVIIGIILFFVFYILRSGMSNIYQVMATVWHWHWEYVLEIQYFNVIGSITGIIVSFFLVKNRIDFRIIFSVGFTLLAFSMLWFSYLFYPETQLSAITPPLVLQGISQGMLFTPLVLYIIGSVHPNFSGSASHAGVAARFWTTTIGFSVMQNAVLYLTTKHQFSMVKNLDKSSPIFQEQWANLSNKNNLIHLPNDADLLSAGVLKSKLFNQALLVSNIEIFRVLFILGIITAFIILVYRPIKNRLFA